jgi:hypothetical protein
VLSTIVTAALLGYVFVRLRSQVLTLHTTTDFLPQFNGFTRVQKNSPFAMGMRSFIHNPLGWFLLSLAVSDFLQGVAFAFNLYWVSSAGIQEGAYCDMQGRSRTRFARHSSQNTLLRRCLASRRPRSLYLVSLSVFDIRNN